MVTLTELKTEQAGLKKELKKAIDANKQLGTQHKHANYRIKREAELKILSDKIEANHKLIEDNSATNDPIYDVLFNEISVLIDEYQQLLNSIPLTGTGSSSGTNSGTGGGTGGTGGDTGGDTGSGTGGGTGGDTGGDTGGGTGGSTGGGFGGNNNSNNTNPPEEVEFIKQMRSQQVRLNNFMKICDQIRERSAASNALSCSFGKIKIDLINSSWERIATAHELLGSVGVYEQDYLFQMDQCDQAMERTLLFLQELMDKSNHRNDGVKLERVTIPKFDGDYFKWVTFRDLFISLVINNKNLSKAQQLQMLKTNLIGEPGYLISDLTIADVNFDAAWGRLQHRYENNRVIVSQHLNKLMTQAMGKWESKSLKKLLDTTDQILLALKNLGRPTEHWDDWIVLIISQKFSEDCRKDWEKRIGPSTDLPTWDDLKQFLEEEFRMLEGVENTQRKPQQINSQTSSAKNTIRVCQTSMTNKGCGACGNDHKLFNCMDFKKMKVPARWDLAKRAKLCFACLRPNHDKSECTAQKKCKHCTKPHSTWLHDDRRSKKKDVSVNAATTKTDSKDKTDLVVATMTVSKESPMVTTVASVTSTQQILLATALISTNDVNGQRIILRALIDSGSQGSLMTNRTAELLRFTLFNTKNKIAPLGSSTKGGLKSLTLTLRPHFNSTFECETIFYVMQKLTRTLPDENIDIDNSKHLEALQLADPTFNKVGPIDVLLGSDIIPELMKDGLIKGNTGQPMAQLTELGWIVSGKIDVSYKKRLTCMIATIEDDQTNLQKFWELEELNPKRALTADELECEDIYQSTVRRSEDGTFIVNIPFKTNGKGPENLGNSRAQCLARFNHLERKFAQNPDLKSKYVQVMSEYISMGHLRIVTNEPRKYYIPHHAVIKPDSLTTQTRVVFDASAKTSTGYSLNDCMHVGAKQQKDLFETLIKWRIFKVAFKADITKMYRMIKMNIDDQSYHTIFWRADPSEELKEYQLTTVTFGTASAPFLAMRTLKQLAMEEQQNHPVASNMLANDFYVDDLISGCHTEHEAIETKNEILTLMAKGGFELRKWSSNNQRLLDTLPKDLTEKSLQTFEDDEVTKALGLQWNPQTDQFNFRISWYVEESKVTKRNLFSEASKLFDPLGWLAPTVINAKLYMQEIWTAKIEWDEEVPTPIKEKWIQFREELPLLEQIKVPRWIHWQPNSTIEIHGFCDASEKAYAAVVYSRIQTEDTVEIQLLASKTRVAPIHLKTTLPRLELCGAVLLSNLLTTTCEALNIKDAPITAWSDSMITLGWLKGAPSKWKTFVANRVSEIQATKIDDWRHVKSADNPADCASRGMMPSELKDRTLWWKGPEWLKEKQGNWPVNEIIEENDDNEKKAMVVNVATLQPIDYIEKTSSWFKLVRVRL